MPPRKPRSGGDLVIVESPAKAKTIERYLGQPGALNFGQALAMSTILMAVTAVGFLAIERFRYGDVGEF